MLNPSQRRLPLKGGFIIAALIVGAGILSIELGISTAVLEIAFGAILRNSLPLFGIGWDEFAGGGQWLETLSSVGLMAVMFMAGFETDLDLLRKNLKPSLKAGIPGFFAPFLVSGAIVYFLFGMNIGKAALMAIALSTTSIALIYAYLRERGLLDHKIGQLLLSTAMVMDISSVLLLTAIYANQGAQLALEIAIILVLFLIAPALGHILFDRYKGNLIELELRFLFLMLLGFTLLTHMTSVNEALVGFSLGVIMGRVLRRREELTGKLSGVVFSMLAPVFFFVAGTRLEITALSPALTMKALLLLVAVAGTKLLVSVAALTPKIPRPAARFAGMLFNYNLTFGIVAAHFGFVRGTISSSEYGVVLLVILASAFIPTVFHRDVPRELDIQKSG
ncbi:MAG: cation:proton antiporter [bacterium]